MDYYYRWRRQSFSVVFAALVLAVANAGQLPKPENLRWLSTNFKTLLTWGPEAEEHTYTVRYAENNGDWLFQQNCMKITETECDLTDVFPPSRTFSAKVTTEAPRSLLYDEYELPSTNSEDFNPYRQSNITAVSFSLEAHAANRSVVLHITDPLTAIYQGQRLLTIREVFLKDLKYKIGYIKVGSTRKKEVVRDSNVAVVGDLEPRQGYCFSVAAFIPSRDPRYQLGAWSKQHCLPANKGLLQELRVEALAGGSLFIILLLIIIIIITVVCCRRRRRRRQHKTVQTLPAD